MSQGFDVFLDMDGVLSDFDKHAKSENKYNANGKLNYDALDFNWWATMPVFSGALDFYHAVQKLSDNVKFLTGPMISADCFGGKADWITRFDPAQGKWLLNHLIICPSKDKQYLAGPNRILVDDRSSNIIAWEKAGGIGVLHTGDFEQTLNNIHMHVKP